MPDPTPVPTDPQDPPAPVPDPTLAPPADPPLDPDEPTEGHLALIAKLREKERQGERDAKALAEAQAKLDEIEREKMTDLERAQAEKAAADQALAVLQQQRRDDALRLAVYAQRDTLGIASPDLAIAALDRGSIEFNEIGEPTNVVDALTALLEREPILKGKPAPTPVPRTDGGTRSADPPDLTADELDAASKTGMDPERYAAIKKAMAGRKAVSVAEMVAAGLGKQG